jgi:hypothetical protein
MEFRAIKIIIQFNLSIKKAHTNKGITASKRLSNERKQNTFFFKSQNTQHLYSLVSNTLETITNPIKMQPQFKHFEFLINKEILQ